jgi:regulatory protein
LAFGDEGSHRNSEPVTIAQIPIPEADRPSETETGERCYNAALRFIKYRPRSEREVRDRLRYRGFAPEEIEAAIASLKDKRLIDDAAFARFWADNRDSFSPRGKRLMKMELRQKGIGADIIQQTVSETDDAGGAYRAAIQKARSLARDDFRTFERRLGGYLQRRGFGYGVIKQVVQHIWEDNP